MGAERNREQSSPAGAERSPEQEQFRQLLAQVDRLWEIGRLENAIRLLHRAEAIEPQNSGVQTCLGHLYYLSKNNVRALKHLESAIALNPEDGYAHRIRACVLCESGNVDEALASAELAVRYKPEVADSSVALVEVLIRKGSLDRAKQVAATMRSRWPENVLVHWCLGFVAAEEFKWREAEAHYRRALKLEPDDSLTLNSLGLALQLQGKQEEARQMYLRAVGVDPTNAVARRNMGRTFYVKPDDPAYKHLPRELKEEYLTVHKRDERLSHYFYLSPAVAAFLYILICFLQPIFSISVSFSLVTVIIFSWTVMAATALAIYGRFGYPPRSVWQFNCGISAITLLSWSFMWGRDSSVAPASFNGITVFFSISILLLLSSYRLVFTLPAVLRFQEGREAERDSKGYVEG